MLTFNVCYRFCFSQNWNIHSVMFRVDLLADSVDLKHFYKTEYLYIKVL